MNLQKITKIGCITLGLLGIIFLFLVFGTGDDTIKMSAASGNFGVITPIILLSQLILFIAVIVTLTFSDFLTFEYPVFFNCRLGS